MTLDQTKKYINEFELNYQKADDKDMYIRQNTHIIEKKIGFAVGHNELNSVSLLNLLIRDYNIKINKDIVIEYIYYGECQQKYDENLIQRGSRTQFSEFNDSIRNKIYVKFH